MILMEGADVFIEMLNAHRVEYIYYNPGFDVVPLLSAAARYRAAGKTAPRPIMCLDEFTALNAAHGNYMVSNRPQVVLVHSELGTQQIGGAIQQAWYGKVPVLICAADMVVPGRLNWKGEPYDQAAMLRNCVKWDYKARTAQDFYPALRKAFEMTLAEPSGPVYLTYPVDLLSQKMELDSIQPAEPEKLPVPDLSLLEQAADILVKADNPLIMTGHYGRRAEAVASLVELAETLGCRVVTSGIRMNFPTDHPLCANLEPNDGQQSTPYHLSADALLVIDYDIPYAYPRRQPRPETKFVHIDTDFVKQGEILWNRTPDIAVRADSSAVIPQLTSLLRGKMDVEAIGRINRRKDRISAENREIRADWQRQGKNAGAAGTISAEWLCYCLNQVIDQDTIVVNQTISPSASVARQIRRSRPGTLLACTGGTIGWAMGATLGAKISAPDRLVVGLMGDGAFIYGGPTATLWPAAYYRAPFLCVIFNNQAYGAIRNLFQGRFKEGIENALINPSPSYAMVAEACGAWGKTLENAEDVLPALQEAVARVRSGQTAVVDVRLG